MSLLALILVAVVVTAAVIHLMPRLASRNPRRKEPDSDSADWGAWMDGAPRRDQSHHDAGQHRDHHADGHGDSYFNGHDVDADTDLDFNGDDL